MGANLNHPDFLELRSSVRENPKDFIAIVGAGLSKPCGLPSWEELRRSLIDDALKRSSDFPQNEQDGYIEKLIRLSETEDLWNCFSELKKILSKPAYEKNIKDNLTLKNTIRIPKTYEQLWNLRIKGILTYNIDKCAIDSYSKVNGKSVDYATCKDPSRFGQFNFGTQDFVFHPHGILADPSTWVFTEEELSTLLSTSSYNSFMENLFQSKHFLILGFNPEDFAFKYLVQKSINQYSVGPKHFIFLPEPDPGIISELGNKNIVVIPYKPEDKHKHDEIEVFLDDILSYLPMDNNPSSVYDGEPFSLTKLPTVNELKGYSIDKMRDLLNGAVLSIIPQDHEPKEEDLKNLELFYNKFQMPIHMAWFVESSSDYDTLFKYRVKSKIGRGAFGQVYMADHITTKETVAVKILLQEVKNDRDYLRSFRCGVRSMRILTKKNVKGMVRLKEAFEIPACIIMEYVEGPNLREAVENKILNSLNECLEVLLKVGNIVRDAHNLEERVLHRDLKPDNVILKNGYIKNAALDVVVLDFDLSWHKGALDLSVVQGARAQGYAAPEQTVLSTLLKKEGISTRHTAVDVFGLGMLAFYLFVGHDPRPNEQNFKDYRNKIKTIIKDRFDFDWHCLPIYLSEIVEGCTFDKQPERIPFSSAVEAFNLCHEMALTNSLRTNHPLILLEIASRLDPEGKFERQDFGRVVTVMSPDNTKKVILSLKNTEENIYIDLQIIKMRGEHDRRNVSKYLENARVKAISKLNSFFNDVHGDISMSRVDIFAKWPVTAEVSNSDLETAVEKIIDARTVMELN